jgi:perosamine synthetase
MYGLFIAAVRATGRNHQDLITRVSHSLAASKTFQSQIRPRPSNGLLGFLKYRISTFNTGEVDQHSSRISEIARRLPQSLQPIKYTDAEHTGSHYWICPIYVKIPERVLDELLDAGFDAASGDASLAVVQSVSEKTSTPMASKMMKSIIHLPVDHQLSQGAQHRLIKALTIGGGGAAIR